MKNQEEFPNGIKAWRETHFIVTNIITLEFKDDYSDSPIISLTETMQGLKGIIELANSITHEFEKNLRQAEHKDDVDALFDDVYPFTQNKLYPDGKPNEEEE